MAGLLYRVTPNDPLTFAAAAGIVSLIALCACCVPAVRAGLLDPLLALRYE
jgi:ABC-type lipoprotein release transport system permease subunit